MPLELVKPDPGRLPRPRGLSEACSDESYYLGVRAWAVGRSDKQVAALLGVSTSSLKRLCATPEWGRVVTLVREEYDDYEIVALTRLYSLSLKIIAKALDEGDPYLDPKTGEVSYLRIKGKDAASISTTLSEQRNLAIKRKAGLPTEEMDIKDELRAIADALRSHTAKEIEGESIRSDGIRPFAPQADPILVEADDTD